jgi:hypothetical protein
MNLPLKDECEWTANTLEGIEPYMMLVRDITYTTLLCVVDPVIKTYPPWIRNPNMLIVEPVLNTVVPRIVAK